MTDASIVEKATGGNTGPPELYGVLAEFDGVDELVEAARRVNEAGYRRTDAFAPFPVHGLAESLGFSRTAIPWVVLVGGVIGLICGFALQYWVAVVHYPLNVGGRPLNSWPMFMPITFEMTILVAALFAVLGMLALNGLPTPHHPLFGVKQFDRASRDGFFLCIEAKDPKFDLAAVRQLLESLKASEVIDVPK